MFRIDRSAVDFIDGGQPKTEAVSPQEQARLQELEDRFEALRVEEEAVRERALRTVQKAREDAQTIVETALAEAESLRIEAERHGRQQGESEAKARQDALELEIKTQFQGFLSYLHETTEVLGSQMEETVLSLSLALAEKIVNVELKKDDIVFRRLIKAAIERLNAKEKFTIHLNRAEYNRYFAKGSGWLEEMVRCEPFAVVADPAVPEGGCVLKSSSGVVDAGIATQMARLAASLGLEPDPESGTDE